jgi:hypothetical protein
VETVSGQHNISARGDTEGVSTLMVEHAFPIPASAAVNIRPVSPEVFNVELSGLTDEDLRTVVAFFMAMQGRFRAFRFAYNGLSYPACRFESDTGPALTSRPGPHSRSIPIRILHGEG